MMRVGWKKGHGGVEGGKLPLQRVINLRTTKVLHRDKVFKGQRKREQGEGVRLLRRGMTSKTAKKKKAESGNCMWAGRV